MNSYIRRVRPVNVHFLHRIFMYIIITVITIVLFNFINSLHTPVNASVTTRRVKYFTSVLVMPGESLDDIAKRYISIEYKDLDEYKDEVRQMNYLDYDCNIHIGEYIVVPYYADAGHDI